MTKPFTVNPTRYDPYKTFRFLVYFDPITEPVAGVSEVGALKRTTNVITHWQGGGLVPSKSLGNTEYQPFMLKRGVTHSDDFEQWANAPHMFDKGAAQVKLSGLRKDIRIDLLNEQRQPVLRYKVYRCWVSEYQALPDLNASENGVAIEYIKLENEGWERVLSLVEPDEATA